MSYVLFVRDRPILNLAFSQIDHKALAEADLEAPADPTSLKAYCRFLALYKLPEYTERKIHSLALSDLGEAYIAGKVPRFVIGLLDQDEIQQLNKEVKRVGSN